MNKLLYLNFYMLIFGLYNHALGIYKITSRPNEVLKFVQRFLPLHRPPVVVEAGAYNGSDTKRMYDFWKGKVIIHSFEPIPENFKLLTKKTQGLKNINRYQMALADFNGVSKFYVSELSSQAEVPSASSSLLEPLEHTKYDKLIVFKKEIAVNTITLDTWAQINKIAKVDFFWLDMQGYELPALKAATKLLKHAKVIYTEACFVEAYKGQFLYKDIKAWLESQGFILVAIDFDEAHAAKGSAIKPGEPYFGNAIFVNSKRVKHSID